mmetsp:Transcript_19221/g.29464  ORF Transcript_19221/g.29464 Transcript_19221/m.29464 type:complete len:112 (-) Transcript_19221:411-746(-)
MRPWYFFIVNLVLPSRKAALAEECGPVFAPLLFLLWIFYSDVLPLHRRLSGELLVRLLRCFYCMIQCSNAPIQVCSGLVGLKSDEPELVGACRENPSILLEILKNIDSNIR